MKTPEDLPEMDAELASLLADAKRVEGPAPEVHARLRARLATALPPLPPAGGPSRGPEAAPAGPWSVPAWVAAATFVVGVGTGLLVPRGASAPAAAAPSAMPSATAAVSASAHVEVPVAASALPAAPAAAKPSAPARAEVASTDLTRERALLDVARTALGRSDAPSALAACTEHERTFPRGALREEREAIAVQALVLAGRGEDARARADRFERAFPSSILLPAVRAASGVSP